MHEPSWHDREPVALAAGVAAFALLALLALAVMRMSSDANPAPYLGPVGPNGTTTTSPTIKPLSSSSYTVPSVQTSQDTGAPPVTTTSSEPPPDGPGAVLFPEVTTPTTIFNPYATTTPQNAGHV